MKNKVLNTNIIKNVCRSNQCSSIIRRNFPNKNNVEADLVCNQAITLISLVITIIVLIILSSVGIYLSLGNNGIFTRAKEAKEETNKQTATEKINFKITTAQMNKYTEEQRMPTLKELSLTLREDSEIQYVTEKSKMASTEYDVPNENPNSIFTKLNDYPYEFEINSSLQLARIDGIPIASVPINNDDTIVTMTKTELDSYINSKIDAKIETLNDTITNKVNLQKTINDFSNRNVITANTNLNDLKTAGLYSMSTSSYANTSRNFPENNIGGILVVYSNGSNSALQIYYGYTGTSNFVHMYARHYYLNTSTNQEFWSDWTSMHT